MADIYYLPVQGTYGTSVQVDTYSLISQFGQEMVAKGLIYGGYAIMNSTPAGNGVNSFGNWDFQISSQQDATIHSLDNQSVLGTQQIDGYTMLVYNGTTVQNAANWSTIRVQDYLKDGIALGRIGIFNLQNPNVYFKTFYSGLATPPAYSGYIKFVTQS